MEIISSKGRDGRVVRVAAWEKGRASEVLLYLNGLESNHSWFAATAEKLAAEGAAVFALDRRGSGLNADLTAGLGSWLDDIAECLKFIRGRHAGARLHLASLCFGAKLAAAFALRAPSGLSSLIFISPGLSTRADLPPGLKLGAAVSSFLAPRKTFPSPVRDDRWFTRREEGLRFIAADALRRRRIPAREFLLGRRLDFRLRRGRRKIGLPCLVLFAERDRVVDKEKTRARLTRLARSEPEFIQYPDTDHCLMFEPEAWLSRDIARWMNASGRPSVGHEHEFSCTSAAATAPYLKAPARRPGNKVLVLETDYDCLAEAVERGLEEFPLPWPGRTVLVKPNVIAGLPPDKHVTTHPRLVRAVADALLRRGALVIVGDNPGRPAYGENERSFRAAGILEAVPELYRNIGLEQECVRLPWAPDLGEVVVSRAVLEADFLVSLPKFKTHQLTQLTGGLKNSYGHIVGGDKARLHRLGRTPRAFARILTDIYLIRPPDLVIVDAVAGMEGEGPTGRDLRLDINRLIVADNAVNADTVMAEMMGLDRSAVPLLEEAYRRGLGEPDFDKLDVRGSFIRLDNFKKPSTYRHRLKNALTNYMVNRFVFGFLFSRKARLVVDHDVCRSCGACQEACPAVPKAMVLEDDGGRSLPRFIKANCRSCYCCMEMCPHQAIDKATLLGKKLFKKIF